MCPFCRLAAGGDDARNTQRDIVRRRAGALAFISPRWWPNNHGHVDGCDGVSTRQHNEPAGNQDTWHYHVHVFPRYIDDGLYAAKPYPDYVTADQRWPYADRLRAYFDDCRDS